MFDFCAYPLACSNVDPDHSGHGSMELTKTGHPVVPLRGKAVAFSQESCQLERLETATATKGLAFAQFLHRNEASLLATARVPEPLLAAPQSYPSSRDPLHSLPQRRFCYLSTSTRAQPSSRLQTRNCMCPQAPLCFFFLGSIYPNHGLLWKSCHVPGVVRGCQPRG